MSGYGEFTAKAYNSLEPEVEKCMRGDGWDYTPSDQAIYFTPIPARNAEQRIADARKQGYGQVVPMVYPIPDDSPGPLSDPNQVVGASLAPETQQRFFSAIDACRVGTRTEFESELGALQAQYGAEVVSSLQTNETYLAALDAWRACMTNAGMGYATSFEAETYFGDAALKFSDMIETTPGAVNSDGILSTDVRSQVQRVADLEIDTAVTDAQCYASEVFDPESAVRGPLEQAFIEAHKEKLRSLIDKVN